MAWPRGLAHIGIHMSFRSKRSGPLFRGFRHRFSLLLLVAGIIILLGAALFLALAPFSVEPQRDKLLLFAAWFGGAGLLLLLIRASIFVVPDLVRRRQSPSLQLRRAEATKRQQRLANQTNPQGKRGGVLILLLVLTGLVAALLLQSHALARTRTAERQASQEQTRLRQAAAEAALAALQRLADDDDLAVDSTNETWAARVEEQTPLGIFTWAAIRDEQSRFDINNLSLPDAPEQRSGEDIALDLQTLCGDFSPSARTDALRDFVDEDHNGAREGDFYRHLTPPRVCPDRVLYGWREVLNIDGWQEEQLARRSLESSLDGFSASLVDHVTLIPVARRRPIPININTASRETLRAVMGIEQDQLVDTVLTLRAIHPIRQLDVFSVTAGPENFERVRAYLDVRSHYFHVRARAEQDGRQAGVEALVMRQDNGRVLVLQWVEEESS